MFPPFQQEIARHYCQQLISLIDNGKVLLKQIAKISEERKDNGLMIGCLVCWNNETLQREILYTVSGNAKELTTVDFQLPPTVHFVPSLVSIDHVNEALKEYDLKIHQLTDKINQLKKATPLSSDLQNHLSELKKQRTNLTDISLKRVFSLYTFTCWNGSKISLNEIIDKNRVLPPTGTGDCCAPKLLSYAFEHKLQPVSMDEIFYGKSTNTKINGQSYSPCDERCGYILPYILGLNIIYRDSQIIVVNKQSGVLSVPGRGEDKQDCIVNRVKSLFPKCIEQPSVHRLDMETSGLLILAFTQEAHKKLSKQFEKGSIHKKYVALLDGVLERAAGEKAPSQGEQNGRIELKFRLDIENRPHQIYDEENGKLGITDWEKDGSEVYTNPDTNEQKRATRVIFYPQTGRTHQLRLASSDIHGFGLPIIGDSLYGSKTDHQRLMLHAFEITFEHPTSGEIMTISIGKNFSLK